LVGISEFPAIILAIHCISCQFPSKKDFLAFFLPESNISFCQEISWQVEALDLSSVVLTEVLCFRFKLKFLIVIADWLKPLKPELSF
jgi:hypothetical protein